MYVIPAVLTIACIIAAFTLLSRPPALLASGAAVAAGAFFAWQATFSNWLWLLLHSYWYVAPLLAFMGGLAVAWYRREENFAVPAALGATALATIIGLLVYGSFLEDRAYLASATTVTSDIPTYDPRPPYAVARAGALTSIQSNGNLVDGSTTHVGTDGRYTSLVAARSLLGGYSEVVDVTVAASGEVTRHNCSIELGSASLDGMFGANLTRKILREDSGLVIDDDDAYGYCEGDTARIVIPVSALRGLFPVVAIPAGAFVYTPSEDTLTRVTTAPGPVYPLSIAERQRNATAASGTLVDWFMNRVGYDSTVVDGENPDASNSAEFTLMRSGGGRDYVTPLVRRGRGTSVVAVSVIPAGAAPDGGLAPMTIHTLPDQRDANSTVAQAVKAAFPQAPWSTPGFGIFEIVPTSTRSWTASLGMAQRVTHTVTIGADRVMCLRTVSGAKIACTNDTVSAPAPGAPAPGTDLTTMTKDELAALIRAAVDELSRRAP